jgi:hypothetical protein
MESGCSWHASSQSALVSIDAPYWSSLEFRLQAVSGSKAAGRRNPSEDRPGWCPGLPSLEFRLPAVPSLEFRLQAVFKPDTA